MYENIVFYIYQLIFLFIRIKYYMHLYRIIHYFYYNTSFDLKAK